MDFYTAQTLDTLADPDSPINNRDKYYLKAKRAAVPSDVIVSTTADLPVVEKEKSFNPLDHLTDREYQDRQRQRKEYFDRAGLAEKNIRMQQDQTILNMKSKKDSNPLKNAWQRVKYEAQNVLRNRSQPSDFELK